MFVIVSQEEEESPAEGSKDEPREQAELKEEAEAPVEDTSQPPPPEPKGDAAPEREQATDKENGEKSEAQVSCRQSQARLAPEAEGADACLVSHFLEPCQWRIEGPKLFLISLSFSPIEAK